MTFNKETQWEIQFCLFVLIANCVHYCATLDCTGKMFFTWFIISLLFWWDRTYLSQREYDKISPFCLNGYWGKSNQKTIQVSRLIRNSARLTKFEHRYFLSFKSFKLLVLHSCGFLIFGGFVPLSNVSLKKSKIL